MSSHHNNAATATAGSSNNSNKRQQQQQQQQQHGAQAARNPSFSEASHYVVTAHPPGCVLATARCNFVSPHSVDVLIAKAGRLEVRQLRQSMVLAEENTTTTSNTKAAIPTAAAAAAVDLNNPFPLLFQVPLYGRVTNLVPLELYHSSTSLIFFLTDRHQYGVLGYNHHHQNHHHHHHHHHQQQLEGQHSSLSSSSSSSLILTHASGSITAASLWSQGNGGGSEAGPASVSVGGGGGGGGGGWANDNTLAVLGQEASSGPMVIVDSRCIVMHLHSGLLAVIPIHRNYNPASSQYYTKTPSSSSAGGSSAASSSSSSSSCLGALFHVRIEERLVLSMCFLEFPAAGNNNGKDTTTTTVHPHICLLHQDARGVQHVTTHVLHLAKRQLHFCQSTTAGGAGGNSVVEWLRKSAVDGGSGVVLAVPPLIPYTPVAAAAAAAASASTSSSRNSATTTTTTPVASGGVLVLGQRQFTYLSPAATKIIPVPQALYLSHDALPPDPTHGMPRFLLGDEFGNLHMLTLLVSSSSSSSSSATAASATTIILGLQLETLGSCNLSRDLCYLGHGLVYVASHLGDSQLIQIHDEPIAVQENHPAAVGRGVGAAASAMEDSLSSNNLALLVDTTYIQVLEEYTNLGPILDFDLIPTAPPASNNQTGNGASSSSNNNNNTASMQQSQVVTCSGTSKMGSLRVIRNGIGMNEYASVEISGISNMWSLRRAYHHDSDSYLVQSFVGQTRVLGVALTTTTASNDSDEMVDAPTEGDDIEGEEEEPFGSLEEVVLPGLESNASTLYVGNLVGDCLLQICEQEVRLIGPLEAGGVILDTWAGGPITIAAANEAGQLALAQRGGRVLYFQIDVGSSTIEKVAETQMEREVSCLNLNPFSKSSAASAAQSPASMDVDDNDNDKKETTKRRPPISSQWLAVGLWDDFTVRLLDLSSNNLNQVQKIHLSSQPNEGEDEEEDADLAPVRRNRNNMMARSLCLITLDFSSSNTHNQTNATMAAAAAAAANPGVDMLFVGLGDGSLISFAVVTTEDGKVSVRSKKEVCLGTQRIDLVPLSTRGGGSCVLATGDRPTVIYLAGIGGGASSSAAQFNPKLCYSSVNVAPSEDDFEDDTTRSPSHHQTIVVNVASPFYSPLLFDTAIGSSPGAGGGGSSSASQHYSLCIADETSLRLGVIDDIQKLHVTTCRLGMAPRRIVHCADGRLFAVGCMESGIQLVGAPEPTNSMCNCIRFMDDTTFDDIKRVDLDPFETIMAMAYVSLLVPMRGEAATAAERYSTDGADSGTRLTYKPFLVVGTGYAIADESEMTRGRVLLYSCEADESAAASSGSSSRTVRQITELSTNGGVLNICQFYEGTILCAVNSKTMLCRLTDDAGLMRLEFVGVGHHGHILSMFVKSLARKQLSEPSLSGDNMTPAAASIPLEGRTTTKNSNSKSAGDKRGEGSDEMLAIVGDLMRSVSVVQYFPEHQILDEIARDFNANWTTAIEMLTDDIYLAAEHWCNFFCLRRNKNSSSEEVRGRLDIVGEYHLGEMCNKFMSGSLVMPVSANASGNKQHERSMAASSNPKKEGDAASVKKAASSHVRLRRPVVVTGSQTLFGTVDGSLGSVLGMDRRTAAFFSTLERAMAKVIRPIGDLSHQLFRAYQGERRMHPAHGFVDGDLVESFLDLNRGTMELVVKEMNRDGGWTTDEAVLVRSKGGPLPGDLSHLLTVEEVVAMVEEISMLH